MTHILFNFYTVFQNKLILNSNQKKFFPQIDFPHFPTEYRLFKKRHSLLTPQYQMVLPNSIIELKKAIFNILEAARILHSYGFCHHDVRWPNILKTKQQEWILIDFECITLKDDKEEARDYSMIADLFLFFFNLPLDFALCHLFYLLRSLELDACRLIEPRFFNFDDFDAVSSHFSSIFETITKGKKFDSVHTDFKCKTTSVKYSLFDFLLIFSRAFRRFFNGPEDFRQKTVNGTEEFSDCYYFHSSGLIKFIDLVKINLRPNFNHTNLNCCVIHACFAFFSPRYQDYAELRSSYEEIVRKSGCSNLPNWEIVPLVFATLFNSTNQVNKLKTQNKGFSSGPSQHSRTAAGHLPKKQYTNSAQKSTPSSNHQIISSRSQERHLSKLFLEYVEQVFGI